MTPTTHPTNNPYKKLLPIVESSLQNAPEGRLRSNLQRGKKPQYYLITPDILKTNPNGKFIKSSERDLAVKLAQKEYDQKFLKALKRTFVQDKQFESGDTLQNLLQVYEKLPPAKKLLVTPYLLPDAEFLKKWTENEQGNQNSYPFSETYTTEKGEYVRSKTEKMIADKLFYKNILYKYEAPLSLKHYGTVFPDFTILNLRTRTIYYLEHFGMMDNPEYCKSALDKIDAYQKNGYLLGNQLQITMESSKKSIDLQILDLMISNFFL